jgi:DNA-binding transcriptional ArsR family regulator
MVELLNFPKVPRVRAGRTALDQDDAVIALSALAHDHRLAVFRLLVKLGPSGLPAGEIAQRIGVSATNASFHLKELDRAGLLRSTRNGRHVRYAVDVEGMRKLLTYLTEDCCGGRPELCGDVFAASAELCTNGKGKRR